MLGLAHELPPELEVVCLRAPGDTPNGGYAWFDLSIDESGFGFDEEGFQYAIALVLQSLSEFRYELPLLLGGFSQGAMVAAAATLVDSEVAGAWLMSGAFPEDVEMPAASARPVLVQHGTLDPVLPIAMGRSLAERLGKAGLAVDYREYPVGHTVSSDGLADGIEWLGAIL